MYRVDFIQDCELVRADGNKKYKFPKGFSLYVTEAKTDEGCIHFSLKCPIILDYNWYIPLTHVENIKISYTRTTSCLGTA
jgi:hypothetical protein